jgi:hypothetical protein
MFYPQANLYPQGNSLPQSFIPQSFIPQNFNPQNFAPLGGGGITPFANTPYGLPQQTPIYAQGQSQFPNWQHAAHAQAALQQQAIQQLIAHQLAAQQAGVPNVSALMGLNGTSGLSAGSISSTGAWTQQQPHHQLLQQLAQYHYLIAQQLTQLAMQQAAVQGSGSLYAGQFVPGQVGPNYVPGGTMH